MALPVRPGQGGSKNNPEEEGFPSRQGGLPSLPELPQKSNTSSDEKTFDSSPVKQNADDGMVVDPKTGKKYKQLPGYKKGVMDSKKAIKNAASGYIGLDQLKMMVQDDKDFDLENLNGSAELFMAHLRVPPDKEEMEKLRKERAERQKEYDKKYSIIIEKEKEDEDLLET